MLKGGRWKLPGAARSGGGTAGHGSTGGEKKGPTSGADMLVTREETRCFSRMRKSEGKMPLGEYAKVSRAGWAEWGGSCLRSKAGRRGVSWAS
jgi:hypothetical protein